MNKRTVNASTYLVYVGKLAKNTTQELLRDHMIQVGLKTDDVADIISLKCRNENESSFCISLYTDDAKKVLYNKNNWPNGVRIRPFKPRNAPQVQPRHSSINTSRRRQVSRNVPRNDHVSKNIGIYVRPRSATNKNQNTHKNFYQYQYYDGRRKADESTLNDYGERYQHNYDFSEWDYVNEHSYYPNCRYL